MDRILENKIIDNMKQYFENDKKYIDHALKVLSYTKELLKQEKGDSQIVFTTAILHDIGIKLCKKKYNSTGGQLQEIEGPPIARKIGHKNLCKSFSNIAKTCAKPCKTSPKTELI